MRLLHTSDWHLGRTFHGQSLLADQEAVLGALADLAAEHHVDVVLISGDLYDRAVPSPEAVQCATRVLAKIRAAGSSIVVISGNHDSAPRLGAFADFLASGGLHLRTAASGVGTPVLLEDAAGPVAFYPVPYLEPELARGIWELPAPASHQHVLAKAIEQVRADLANRATGTRSVVLAHAFVVGASPGGSERSIAVGGVESVTAEIFDGFDYVALGHLHSAQVVTERIRYSGSPLPYSFSEAGQQKCAWLVDLDAEGRVESRRVDLPVIRRLAVVRGTMNEILVRSADLADAYLSVELTDPIRPLDPMRRLREVLPHTLVASWVPDVST
ncbi:MAG: exonuclease SbcCD subunit D, partial [Nakamurella sp.]